jgi:hypothetical protein
MSRIPDLLSCLRAKRKVLHLAIAQAHAVHDADPAWRSVLSRLDDMKTEVDSLLPMRLWEDSNEEVSHV